ncbi:MAG: Mcm10/DnaG-type zinc finger protein [candidate division Zixibacteria bacterium]|nr:Mcm10/DnaG-type zinc finger protein [candidate division Zixibacteria bacterium]
MLKVCKFIKDDGESCQAPVIEGSEYCFFHHPGKVVERLEAASRGGKSRVKVLDQSDIKIKSLTDVVRLLEQTVNQVRTGLIDVRISNSIGLLSNVLVRAMEQEILERKLDMLEKQIGKGELSRVDALELDRG